MDGDKTMIMDGDKITIIMAGEMGKITMIMAGEMDKILTLIITVGVKLTTMDGVITRMIMAGEISEWVFKDTITTPRILTKLLMVFNG